MATATGIRKTGRTNDGRYRVYDPQVGHLVYKQETEMSPGDWAWFQEKYQNGSAPAPVSNGNGHVSEVEALRAQLAALQAQIAAAESPAAPQSAPVAPEGNRYANRIRQYEERVAVLRKTVDNPAESDDRRGRAATDIEQFLEAIDVCNEAALIPEGERAWFVSNEGDFRVIIPPAIPGLYNRDRDRVESYNQYYHASNPIEIAVLRRATKRAGSSIFEKPEGTFPIMDWESRTFEGWGSWELFLARDSKRYKAI